MDVLDLRNYAVTLVLGVLLLLSVYLFGKRTFSIFKQLGLSGPKPISHLGNLIELKKLSFAYVFKHWREVYGDTYGIFFGVGPVIITSDPEIIQDILVKRFSIFTNRPIFLEDEISSLAISMAMDDHWKYLRTVMAPSYTSHQMRGMNTMIQTCANTLEENIGKLADSGEMTDVKKMFSAYTIDVISATGFGVMVDSQKNPDDPLVKKAKDIFKFEVFAPLIFITFLFPSARKYIIKSGLVKSVIKKQIFFRKFCKKLIDERKKTQVDNNMQKNFLNLMLKAQVKGHGKLLPEEEKELKLENITDWRTKRGITDDEILAQCVILFLAGYETTSSALTFFTHLMAVNPESQETLYQEIIDVLGKELPTYDNVQQLSYLNMCMDETLRMYPIGSVLTRQCKKQCTIKGVTIPKDFGVMVAVDALHYNPKYWPEPEKFIPERFSEEAKSKQLPFTYLPFGAGPRMCLGMKLAKLEFKIAAVQMIRNFKILPTEKTENPLVLGGNFLLQPKNGVWVKFERR